MLRRTLIQSFLGSALLVGRYGAGAHAQPVSADVTSSIAPTGRLRVAINYGNVALAHRDPATGALSGISVDIAEEVGRRLMLPIVFVPFDAAGKVSAAAARDVWDVAFLAGDPERARDIDFTAPYLVINGTYVVRKDSAMTTPEEVDRDGVRISVSARSIYDLFLTREIKHATLVRAGSPAESAALFQAQHLEACAGVQSAMQQLLTADPGLRMIPRAFMQIRQAMGTPAGRPAAATYLKAFVESIKSNGFVQQALVRNNQADAAVAPPG
jgi:polar amino acid transport system substrate-binding protein